MELQLGYFPSYILLFIAGIIAQRQGWLAQIPEKLQHFWKWIAICLIPVMPLGLILTGGLDGHINFNGGLNLQALLYALCDVGAFYRFRNYLIPTFVVSKTIQYHKCLF